MCFIAASASNRHVTAAMRVPWGSRCVQLRGARTRSVARTASFVSMSNGENNIAPFALTTPLYYVNAAPHMGSAYTTMAVDALARFQRMAGLQPVFVTGCDEHGEKIAMAAQKAGREPQIHCDEVAAQFDDLWKKLDISYDRFVRTTSSKHETVVTQFMKRVIARGDIYKAKYEGLYCTGCEEYKDPKELLSEKSLAPGFNPAFQVAEEDGSKRTICPNHRSACEPRSEENYFFALTKYKDKLEALVRTPGFVLPADRKNEVLGWITDGLRDFSVSRANNPWGITMPNDPAQTIYVWFDALLGYISALDSGDADDETSLDSCVAQGWPADVHVIGKDILRFHAVYWPAMLMSAGLPLPRRVFGHGFLTKDGMKMGKSLGNTLDPNDLVDRFGVDAVRFYFLRTLDFGRDGDFAETRFVDTVNADLANSLGNLLNRSLNLLYKNGAAESLPFGSDEAVDFDDGEFREGRRELRALAADVAARSKAAYHEMDFSGACDALMSLSSAANTLIDIEKPWGSVKDEQRREVGFRTLITVLEAARIVSAGLAPIVPRLAARILEALGFAHHASQSRSLSWDEQMTWGVLRKGHSFEKPKPLFPRLERASNAAPTTDTATRKKKTANAA